MYNWGLLNRSSSTCIVVKIKSSIPQFVELIIKLSSFVKGR